MALCVSPPPHGFSHARCSSKMATSCPARASCSPHMAPEGPPPTIATFDMGRPLAVLKKREFRRESLCEREDRQGKTGAQYSTEDRCCRGTLCLTPHYVHRQPLQHRNNHKVQRQQHNQYLSGVQEKQRRDARRPYNATIRQSSNQPSNPRICRVRAKKNLFREHPRQKCRGQRRHARPSRHTQPRLVETVVTPNREKEKYDNRADSGGNRPAPGGFQRVPRFAHVHSEQNEARDQQQACKIIALKQPDGPQPN